MGRDLRKGIRERSDRLRAAIKRRRGQIRARWKRWRWRRLYSRRDLLTGGVGLIIAVLAVRKAFTLLDFYDPPGGGAGGSQPAIFLAVRPPRPGGVLGLSQFVIDVGVHANGCSNPVHVAVGLGLRGKQNLAPARYLRAHGAFIGELVDPTHTAHNFVEGELSREAWRGAFTGQLADHYASRPTQEFINTAPLVDGTDAAPFMIAASWKGDSKDFGAPLNTWFAESSVTQRGVSAFPIDAMEITFNANWVSPRSYGTCYVRLPNITTFPSLQDTVLRPRSGAVVLAHPNDETVDTSLSIPPPTDPRGPTWTCKIVGPSNAGCGGFAVLEQPNANRDTQFYLLISGAFIGLGFAMAAESLVKFNWPLLEREAPDDD